MKNKGFTLVELLVVIVVGVLAAISIPRITETKAEVITELEAQIAQLQEENGNLKTANEVLRDDNDRPRDDSFMLSIL